MKQVGFRARLFLILLGFTLIPTIVLSAAWELTMVRGLPLLGTTPAIERLRSESGALEGVMLEAIAQASQLALSDVRRAAMLAGGLRPVARAVDRFLAC